MYNKLNELGKQQSTVCGMKTDLYQKLRSSAIEIVSKHLTDFPNVDASRCTIDSYAMGKAEIRFTIAFKTENGYDFGSDFDLTYEESYNRLFINFGTIGRFTCDDVYQCERIQALNTIVSNRLAIEMELDALCKTMGDFISLMEQAWEIESEIRKIKRAISDMEIESITKRLSNGTVYQYVKDASKYHHMIPANGRWFSLVKVTPQKVRLHIYGDPDYNTYLVDKSQFVYQIKNGVINEVTA